MSEDNRAVTSRAFSSYERPFEMVTSFRYLRRVISLAHDNWPAVVWNMEKARAVWRKMTNILSREGGDLQVSRFFFKAIIKLVLLFGAETWVVTPVWAGSWGVSRTRWRGS